MSAQAAGRRLAERVARAIALALVLLSSAGGLADGPPEPRRERLSNGLTVVIVEDRREPLVSVQLWFAAGSVLDPPSQAGLGHVARCLVQQRADVDRRLHALGAATESRTLPDACYFAALCAPAQLDAVLALQTERLRPATTDAGQLAAALDAATTQAPGGPPEPLSTTGREGGASISGARLLGLRRDDFDLHAPLERTLLSTALAGTPYGRPSEWLDLGAVPSDPSGFSPRLPVEDLREFLERWFVPGNATVLIVGAVEVPAALDAVGRVAGGVAWREPPRRPEAPSPPEELVRRSEPFVRSGLTCVWIAPPASYFENAAIDVLMHVLCNPIDGRLCPDALSTGGAAARWQRWAWRDAGLLMLSVDDDAAVPAGAQASQPPPDAEARVRAALERLAASPVDAIALRRARALALRAWRERRETLHRRVVELGAWQVIGGDVLLADFEPQRLARVSALELQSTAATLHDTFRLVVRRETGQTAQPIARRRLPPIPDDAALQPNAPATSGPATNAEFVNEAAYEPVVPGRARYFVAAVDGAESVRVETRTRGVALPRLGGLSQLGPLRVHDYVTLHGLRLGLTSDGRSSALVTTGPAGSAERQIELHARLLRAPELPARDGSLASAGTEPYAVAERLDALAVSSGAGTPSPHEPPVSADVAVVIRGAADRESARAAVARFFAEPLSRTARRADERVPRYWEPGDPEVCEVRIVARRDEANVPQPGGAAWIPDPHGQSARTLSGPLDAATWSAAVPADQLEAVLMRQLELARAARMTIVGIIVSGGDAATGERLARQGFTTPPKQN